MVDLTAWSAFEEPFVVVEDHNGEIARLDPTEARYFADQLNEAADRAEGFDGEDDDG